MIGGLYKDSGGLYTLKWLYEDKIINSIKRYGNGAVELAGALAMAGALSGVTSLAMAGALSGATDVGASGVVTAGAGVAAGTGNTATLTKVIEIVNWNMDTTNQITVAHGLTMSKIVSISGVVYQDDYSYVLPISLDSGGAATLQVVIWEIIPSGVVINRLTGGVCDSVDWDSVGGFVRGRLYVKYLP